MVCPSLARLGVVGEAVSLSVDDEGYDTIDAYGPGIPQQDRRLTILVHDSGNMDRSRTGLISEVVGLASKRQRDEQAPTGGPRVQALSIESDPALRPLDETVGERIRLLF